ncbi:MBL fold metallo-hydrolase [Pedomonas mirosovicensis]|uniref:MBL fold metallo-hydrolase n=1 Tax=Pedomonas mirosovicensis TaxID=2908641 RepID=UPI002167FC2D|nr:MBL fold metallo-hydrolase [Pedomonas mirosovicensis]MCH8685266.1 MBL fold metallo-hydrolase [Pedomonas mirosovicensis]
MKVRILGCGTSGGVPRVGNLWGRCDPKNPKNRRRRVSILVEDQGTKILVDTSPDLREQLLDAEVKKLDAVLYTHDHADHTHGIDDLRGLYHSNRRPLECYANEATATTLSQRFGYIFTGFKDYPAIANLHVIDEQSPLAIGPVTVQPFPLVHGGITSIGYRFGKLAYTTDLNAIPAQSEQYLYDLDLWIVDALRYDPHPTHPHLGQTLQWIDKFKPKRAILTHMNWELDYDELKARLPLHVEPGYDGMEVEL